jgi:hypothetical protein
MMDRMTFAGAVALLLASGFPLIVEAQGSIAGRVLADSTRVPIPAAELIIAGASRQAVSDSAGRFVLRDLPSGTLVLITRAPGFRPDTSRVELFDDESVSREVLLKRAITTLGEVRVRDSAIVLVPAKLRAFEERRRAAAGGRFLDSTVIVKWETRKTGDLLSMVAGVDVQRSRSAAYVTATRATQPLHAAASSRAVPCFMDVYLDGAAVALASTPFDVNSIGLNHVAGIEVYSGAANIPAQYNRTSKGCGVVLIWTK